MKKRLRISPCIAYHFSRFQKSWDHEHCIFCWEKFYLHEECLQEGYCTRPQNARDADRICPECYEDFKGILGWTLKRGDTE